MAASSTELTKVLQLLRDPSNHNLSYLQGLWRNHDPDVWAVALEPFIVLGERILKLGEPLMAYDVVAEGIKSFPKDVHLRQLLALALARSGAPEPANAVLVELYQEGSRDEETLGLLARTHKDLAADAVDAPQANRHLRMAYEFYNQAYRATAGYWSAINAATLALLLGESDRAHALAREITTQCREKLNASQGAKTERYWLLSTLGEAALLLNHWSEAEDWYEQAIAAGHGDWGSIQSTRRNACLLMQHLDGDGSRIQRLFNLPSVIVFSGHMIDRPGRAVPRFPPELENRVQDAIRERLQILNAGFGYASAACGSDILFLEAMLELKGEIHIVLPFEKHGFVRESVDIISGSGWPERLDRVVAQAASVHVASRQSQTGGAVLYEFVNHVLHGLAAVRAEQLQTKLVPLAVWNGQAGDGEGGSASAVADWRKSGLNVEIIDLEKILRERFPSTNPPVLSRTGSPNVVTSGFAPEIRALLFADAQGYSKLTDDQIPRFVEHFLGLVAKLASESAFKPLVVETWGDAVYFVFDIVRDAGRFALDLRDGVRNIDWVSLGLPKINLRVALHAGPVYLCTNPVTGRPACVGPHVSRAARIEPITPPGQVYASQEFVALAAADGVKELRCDYVGQTLMAKNYGTFPMYVVHRRRADR